MSSTKTLRGFYFCDFQREAAHCITFRYLLLRDNLLFRISGVCKRVSADSLAGEGSSVIWGDDNQILINDYLVRK